MGGNQSSAGKTGNEERKREPVSQYFDVKKDGQGREYMEVFFDGIALLRLVATNKGTAFSQEERVGLSVDGLLPPQVETLEQQVNRIYHMYRRQADPISKYQFLRDVQERSEVLFFALLEKHLEEMLPIVYTPTVGQAVQEYSNRYQSPRGLSFSTLNIDRAEKVAQNYPWNDVRMIVATDSSAILGIGDQGYGGLAIAIGKLSLYTVAGGMSPLHTSAVKLDVGTDRIDLINDELYLGVRQRRLRGDHYLEFFDKFVSAVQKRWPGVVIQWEDLAKEVAFAVLERYRDVVPSFNDDIQGTGAVALAGALSACRMKNESIKDQRFVVHGAGAGGIGVAWALVEGLIFEGLSREEAHAQVFVVDSRGLLVEGRSMEPYKQAFAQPADRLAGWRYTTAVPTLIDVIENAEATGLVGLSAQPGAFTKPIVQAVMRNTARPIIFPLSNPTSKCEALPEDVLEWTNGQAIVATGSPFPDVNIDGKSYPIGQGNNVFIFPGLGMASVLTEASSITNGMVMQAAHALAEYTAANHLESGLIFPPVDELQEVSIRVATRVAEKAFEEGVARKKKLQGRDLDAYFRARFWKPKYLPMVRAHQ
jgi:malate dehydrogenase (oxaloacetate-decarboxylating)